MSRLYQEGHRELQRQFDTERLADRLEQVTYHTLITPEDRDFIERRDMFFLATADAEGRPNCSYKGGDPGFVRVLDRARSCSRTTTATACSCRSATRG